MTLENEDSLVDQLQTKPRPDFLNIETFQAGKKSQMNPLKIQGNLSLHQAPVAHKLPNGKEICSQLSTLLDKGKVQSAVPFEAQLQKQAESEGATHTTALMFILNRKYKMFDIIKYI